MSVTLKLTNTDDAPCAYKVKCTSNAFFKIRPPVGVLDKTGNVNVTITFTLGDAMMPVDNFHFISIYYLDGVEASKTGREVSVLAHLSHAARISFMQAWKDQEPTGSKRLQVTFDRPADEANQDEKEDKKDEKEEDKKEDKEDETTDDKKEEKKEADEEEPSGATQ
jgi:hypothetical protein